MGTGFEITFLGTSGSCTYSAGNRNKYGVNTPCVAVNAGSETIIFDAGSGIVGFGDLHDYHRDHIRLFFTHYHIDHINGLLFCSQLFNRERSFDLYGHSYNGKDIYGILGDYLSEPLQPGGIGAFTAKLGFHTVETGDVIQLSEGVTVRAHDLSHPGGSTGYRVEYGGKSLCYCTDIELNKHKNDSALLDFIRDVDLLIIDSGFDDGKVIEGWGHSSWRECAEWSKEADVKQMALFHYGYKQSDDEIADIERRAKAVFPGAFASADRMRVVL